ncbi:MAG TPA: hypothetical protein VHZ81_08615 [Galbitalea sp.]|jgi:hypothetical protein|nr:hypothetical protein [Galbitalea sp.]
MVTTNHSLPSEAEFARLEGELFARIGRKHRSQVLRHRLAAAVVVAAVAGAGVAAGTVANPTQERTFADCYASASTASAMHQTQYAKKQYYVHPSTANVARAVQQCAALWDAGVYGGATTPQLQACLADNLIIAVFPRESRTGSVSEFCENLGMSAP